MKPFLTKSRRELGKQVVAGCVIISLFSGPISGATKNKAPVNPKPETPVKVNRSVPKVQPPKGGLQFSRQPTAQEIFQARIFEEPLVPIGLAAPAETAALAAALLDYAKRSGPDDFSSLTTFLKKYPKSAWRASLLTNLGLEYYNTAHYSLALAAWTEAWALAKEATEPAGKSIGDRAAGELAAMYARLGRMEDLEPLLQAVEGRQFVGSSTEKIAGAQAGLSNMKERPEVAFRCGPLALHRIKLSLDPTNGGDAIIIKSASTQKGLSLPAVAELSRKIDLNYEMAFRDKGAPIVVPSVVHWKVGHYAAITRQEGDRFLIQDPTFINDVWATREALESESSGYFLIPPGELKQGWRTVDTKEGGEVWGKGNVGNNDPDPTGCKDPKKGSSCGKDPCKGMAVADVHLMPVSLNIMDEPVGYSPPVGERISFQVTYNQREANQPTGFAYSSFGPKWTFEWLAYITDNPFSPAANAKYYMRGGGSRVFTGFNATTQSYAYQQYEQDRLTRTSSSSYEILSPDGSRKVFAQTDGSTGTSRKIFLTQVIDPFGNTVSITYDANFRVVAVTDAIGQVSTLTYTNPSDIYKITKITDPFGRFATFEYDLAGRLVKITDVIGIVSQFTYESSSDFINSLITPYGTTAFTKGGSGTTRWLETLYPNGERDRVEFNQSTNLGIPQSLPADQLPAGMRTHNDYMSYRNTYYWNRNAYAKGCPDYTKAKLYHWLHTADGASAAGILESTKEPLEGRIWYDYPGQGGNPSAIFVGTSNKPTHIGRVLDDGTTQLYTFEYDNFGHVTKSIDPIGRTTSYLYAANGIDLLETRQTRAGSNELLSKTTYNAQHLPLTRTDSAGQTATATYNPRGQLLTSKNARNEVTTYAYDSNGYRTSVDGPLPGAADLATFTYDGFGRVRTLTNESGYTLTYDYDALDRLTRATFPDSTYQQNTYTALDLTQVQDRAGQLTLLEYNPLRQLTKRTDRLGRVTRFEWCGCGDMESLIDPMGRVTTWENDVQGRTLNKTYPDGSKISYVYEEMGGRLRERIDEKFQITRYTYNRDDTLKTRSYGNVLTNTPPVGFVYDPNYKRVVEMTDGSGLTRYTYHSITSAPALGAGEVASIDGPLPNDTIEYAYDELGRATSAAINGVATSHTFDAGGRQTGATNALGSFTYGYDGGSRRRILESYPNGQTTERGYGTNAQDRALVRISQKKGAAQLSEHLYGHDVARNNRITSWSQQIAAQPPSVYTLGYDAEDQLTSASVTNSSGPNSFAYTYDATANRLTETQDAAATVANYNSLNELTSTAPPTGVPGTYEWDGEQQLAAVNAGNERTEFRYDGLGRRVAIRKLVNGSEVSHRKFVWNGTGIAEERDAAGGVVKRFFLQGMKIEVGPNAGAYFYTRDHLGSIRELTDTSGNVRARYAYDPFGRSTKLSGDWDADFGFAGMFWSREVNLNLTWARAYNPAIGRWLSRDPLANAELEEGPNLYAYVNNNVVNAIDPLGLYDEPFHPGPVPDPPGGACCQPEYQAWRNAMNRADSCERSFMQQGYDWDEAMDGPCLIWEQASIIAMRAWIICSMKPCPPPDTPPPPPPGPKPKPKPRVPRCLTPK